jgi:hypothetical protein
MALFDPFTVPPNGNNVFTTTLYPAIYLLICCMGLYRRLKNSQIAPSWIIEINYINQHPSMSVLVRPAGLFDAETWWLFA